ncbi:hypothetical protein KR054_011499 [Drosophila jambulina]|nr:hypothetical protein KR054_011499 [Drosophila jambulina]
MPSAKDKTLRRERVLQFINENQMTTPPQYQERSDKSLRQKKRVTFTPGKQQRSLEDVLKVKDNQRLIGQGLTSCLITKSSDTRLPAGSDIPAESVDKKLTRRGSDSSGNSGFNRRTSGIRISGGENNPSIRNVGKLPRTDSECQFKSPGFNFLKTRHSEVSAQEVRLNPVKPIRKELKNKCDFFPKYVDNRPFKDQTTQTLYRESSAQTLAYFPEISNKENAETLELFSLAKLLPGENPPGLHEVEILERARKRWLFQEAIKRKSTLLLNRAKGIATKPELRDLLEAFEWEQWIEREEYIQECQMIRLQIVIKMFDKREKEMHAASKIRIEQACEGIEKRRQAALRKNEIEFQRGVRRLDMMLPNHSRKWKKQSPIQALGSPCSRFYAPIMRHGVDPARRNYEPITGRKAFDMRIDDLEKRVNMKKVQCPFSKLKEWSKPKEYVREYEQNFCKDENLQRLYESLKHLRTQADKVTHPKCLKKRILHTGHSGSTSSSLDMYDSRKSARFSRYSRYSHISSEWKNTQPKKLKRPSPIQPVKSLPRTHDHLENLVQTYEGTYIGSIMQFLSDEMDKLKEQRKLHLFSILAQRERWMREASEAGLRQKENNLRLLYEEIMQHSHFVVQDATQEVIDTIMTRDIEEITATDAANTVTEMARQLDNEIKMWLESFKLVQNPLNYVPMRQQVLEMICPTMESVMDNCEPLLIVRYIVEDVIFGRVWEELEPFDVVSTLTDEFIDRLIDNDLFLFSTDSESDSPRQASWKEAHAIIRKLIRQAVPGKRWMEESERIATETYKSLFDDIFDDIVDGIENPPNVRSCDLIPVCKSVGMHTVCQLKPKARRSMSRESLPHTGKYMNAQFLSLIKKLKEDKVTSALRTDELPIIESGNSAKLDTFIRTQHFVKKDLAFAIDSELNTILSVLDITEYADNLKSLHGSNFNPVERDAVERDAVSDMQCEEGATKGSSEPKHIFEEETEENEVEIRSESIETAQEADEEGEGELEEEPLGDEVIYSVNQSRIFSFR